MSRDVRGARGLVARFEPVAAGTDNVFFAIGGVAVIWLAWLLLNQSRQFGTVHLLWLIPFWLVVSYLALPRVHRVLTSIYLPPYFLGRARTTPGLLGDAVNLAVNGTALQIHVAMTQAGWTLADPLTVRTGARLVSSWLHHRSYTAAPVSSLLLFDRVQCLAYEQEVEGDTSRRHHVRFWRCPDGWLLPGGAQVGWLGAGSFDTRVGLSRFTFQVTHHIAPDIDQERDHVIATLQDAHAGVSVTVLKDFSTGYHSRNGGGDAIQTDGSLPIVDLTQVNALDRAGGHVPEQVVTAARGYPPDPATGTGTASGDGDVIQPGGPEQRHGAPFTVLLGAVASLAGALVQGAYAADRLSVALGYDEPSTSPGPLLTGTLLLIGVLLVLVAIGLVALLVSGVPGPRFLLMATICALLLIQQVDRGLTGYQRLTVVNLAAIALDVVVLLALSSKPARDWTRDRKVRRAERRAAPAT